MSVGAVVVVVVVTSNGAEPGASNKFRAAKLMHALIFSTQESITSKYDQAFNACVLVLLYF